MKAASDISVSHFRQILIWPLFLHKVSAGKKTRPLPRGFLDEVTQSLETENIWAWDDRTEQTAKLKGLPGYDAEEDYSEIVYFHSFVRDFLYGGDGANPTERPLRVFRRSDVQSYGVTLKGGGAYVLPAQRCELYLFESGVLILVLEVKDRERADTETKLKLSEVLDLQNALRMVFPRRWEEGEPEECPLRAEIKSRDETLAAQDYKEKDRFTKIVREHAELPAAAHLQFLLQPLGLYGATQEGYSYQQIEDQRVPSMTYLAVEDPREITNWDYARLTFFDGSGESTVGSYSDEYLGGWETKWAYNRFWQRTPSPGYSRGVHKHNSVMRTRWLCCGYGLVAVGSSDDSTYTGQILANFHHHYFRMGLITHFHRASILILRDALADATKMKADTDKTAAITEVQEEMVKFRSRYWFPEVSTQLQGQEIFRWWSDLLGNPKLFQQVSSDIDAAAALVRTQRQEIESENIKKLTKLAAVIGTVGLVLSFLTLVAAILSWSFLHVGESQSKLDPRVAGDAFGKFLLAVAAALFVSALLGLGLWSILRRQFVTNQKTRSNQAR